MTEKAITHWHQSAKNMLQRIGVPGAQDYTSHAVDELAYTLFRLNQLEAHRDALEAAETQRREIQQAKDLEEKG